MQRQVKDRPEKPGPSSPPDLVLTAGRSRVLAVDDDQRNLTAISEVLAPIAEVVSAQSGEEALRFLLKEEFAVILLDVLMPGLDGYETAALIRQREQSKRTPIIFLTAINKEQAHMLRGYDAGAVDFVFKPFDPAMLRSKVAVFIELFEKTREIQQKAAREQHLLEETLQAQVEKLEAERALRKAEQRQALILGVLPLALFVEDLGEAVRAPRFIGGDIEKLTGFPTGAFTKDPGFWSSRLHPDDSHALVPPDHRAVGTREYRWLHADGAYRHFLEQVIPFEDEGLAGTLLDVTDRRQLEDRLMQAQRLDAIGKLTGGLAHDFNNLLAAILSGLDLLERRAPLDQNANRVVALMRHSAQQGTDLVNRMLAFSRRQQLQPKAVALPALADTMNGLVAQLLGGLVRFEWEVDDTVWPVHVDIGQLELAFMNLIFNARDAMPSGGTISVRARNQTIDVDFDDLSAGDYVVVTVKDTGSGIAPEILPKVIEPFFTTKAVGKGTGLGLSTAYGFARQSGGTLRIDSVVGRGTSMELWLPRSHEQIKDQPHKPQEASRVESGRTMPSVLLVDDSASLRNLTAQSLRERGFEVTTAAGGAEALACIEKEPRRFDVIVTDFAMPLISGLDVIRVARSLRRNWPAIIISGYVDADAIEDRPADVALLSKPFSDSALVDSILDAVRCKS